MYGSVDIGAGAEAAITGIVAIGIARLTVITRGLAAVGFTDRAATFGSVATGDKIYLILPATPAFFQRFISCLSAGVVRFGGEIIFHFIQIPRIAGGIIGDIIEHVPDIFHEFKLLELGDFGGFDRT